jgi:hypothetical protein
MRLGFAPALPDRVYERLVAVMDGLAVRAVGVPELLCLSASRLACQTLPLLGAGDLCRIRGLDLRRALLPPFGIKPAGCLPLLPRLLRGTFRRRKAVVEGMEFRAAVGAANDALSHLVVICPTLKPTSIMRYRCYPTRVRVDEIDDDVDVPVRTVCMLHDDRLKVLHPERFEGA